MSFGLQLYTAAGVLGLDMQATLARVVGYGAITFALNEFSTKSVAIAGVSDADQLVIQSSGTQLVVYTVQRSPGNIEITRTAAYQGKATTHFIIAVRMQ